MKRFTIERRIQLAFLLAFITLSLIGYFSYHSVRNLSEALKEEKETQQILQHLSETLILVLNSETGGRGYALTGNNIFLEPFDTSKDKIKTQIKELQTLLKDNPEQTKNLKKLEIEIDQKLNFIKTLNDVRENADVERTAEIVNSLFEKKSMDNIRQIIKGIEDEETNTLKIREDALASNLRFTYWILLFGSIGGVFSIGLANLAIFLETVKRTKAEKELKETNKNLETRVEERTLQLSAANQELEKNSDFVRATLDSLSAHIAVVDRTGKILVVNEQWEKFSNVNGGDEMNLKTSVGENYLEVCRQAGKKDKIASSVFNNLSKILEGKRQTYRIEYPCHSPNEERWFILQINPLVSENGGAVISHFDITDRKKIENELRISDEFNRSIYENSPDCVTVLEPNGTLLSMNTNGMYLMEIEDFKPFIGRVWTDFWDGKEPQKALQAVEMARNGKANQFEDYGKTAGGTLKYWEITVNPIFDDKGKPIRLISTLRDVTERKEAETERDKLFQSEQTARHDAEIANRMRDEFLATVSHELRAPLNSILGWGKMLQQGKLNQEMSSKAIDSIVRNANSQNRLIEDLLDVSRIISGKVRLEIVKVKLNKLVETALESVSPAADAKNIRLNFIEDAKVSNISGDPNRLQQVIWNLLTNAIKFTPHGGEVTVEIKRLKSEVEILVSDTGIGIKEEFLPHIFKRFSQADSSSVRKFGGLGLGLAIVRHIVEMHGGNVKVISEGENTGAVFIVSLPLIVDKQDYQINNDTQELKKEFLTAQKNISLEGLLILIVDDEIESRQMLLQALMLYGATVITASNVKDALDQINAKNPDIIVSDIGMPEDDGYSLIKKVRALPNEKGQIPAIAVTAFSRAQDRARALNSGFQNHISKPVEIERLATIIAEITGRWQKTEIL